MVRNALGKVMWVGRATVFLVGLAVILALVLGVATTAFGANGDFFKLGKRNVASAVSTLAKSGVGPALKLEVGRGAPLAVNSSSKVAKLNADKIDGKDSTALLPGGALPRGRTVTGSYVIRFNPTAAGQTASESISFGYSLASEPTAHFIPWNTAPPSGCPGTASNPQADPGFLCIYEVSSVSTANTVICNPVNATCGVPASRYGAYLRTDATGAGSGVRTLGTWAVTGS